MRLQHDNRSASQRPHRAGSMSSAKNAGGDITVTANQNTAGNPDNQVHRSMSHSRQSAASPTATSAENRSQSKSTTRRSHTHIHRAAASVLASAAERPSNTKACSKALCSQPGLKTPVRQVPTYTVPPKSRSISVRDWRLSSQTISRGPGSLRPSAYRVTLASWPSLFSPKDRATKHAARAFGTREDPRPVFAGVSQKGSRVIGFFSEVVD